MKITKEDLKQIIKEELDSFLAEGSDPRCPQDEAQANKMARKALQLMNDASVRGDVFAEMEIGEKYCIRNKKQVGQNVKIQFNNGVIVQVPGKLR